MAGAGGFAGSGVPTSAGAGGGGLAAPGGTGSSISMSGGSGFDVGASGSAVATVAASSAVVELRTSAGAGGAMVRFVTAARPVPRLGVQTIASPAPTAESTRAAAIHRPIDLDRTAD
ncbi:MAG TPA: hypothetical protein VHT91_07510, partial [Kofleriaceae bacterium]|nr:hypothetical protein [Kofleriaceae bacterium]